MSTGFIEIPDGASKLYVTMRVNSSTSNVGLAFYTSADESAYISGVRERTATTGWELREIGIPDTAEFFRTTYYSDTATVEHPPFAAYTDLSFKNRIDAMSNTVDALQSAVGMPVFDWAKKSIRLTDGYIGDANNRIISQNFVPDFIGAIETTADYKFLVYVYSDSDTYVGVISDANANNVSTTAHWLTFANFTRIRVNRPGYIFRILFSYADDSNCDLDIVKNLDYSPKSQINARNEALTDEVNGLKSAINGLYTLTYTPGAMIENSSRKAVIQTTGTGAPYKFARFDCTGYTQLIVNTYCASSKPLLVTDENDNILASFQSGSGNITTPVDITVTVPSGGTRLYINCNGSEGYAVTISGVTVRGEIDKAATEISAEVDALGTRVEAVEDVADDVTMLTARMDGTSSPLTMVSVPKMIGSDGTEKTETSTLKFFQINGIDQLSSVTFTFEHSISGGTVHYFNQYSADDTLLSYASFGVSTGDGLSYSPTLEPNVAYIKVSVWTSNGTVTASGMPSGICLTANTVKVFNKVSGLGDSITAGYAPSGNVTDTYQKLIADRLGAAYQRLGVVSTPICPNSDATTEQNNNAFVYRYTQIANDADLIIVAGGTNDFRHNVPLGTAEDTSAKFEETFYGALDYLIQNIITAHIYAKIVFVTPFHQWQDTVANTAGHKLTDYIDAIKTVCERYGVNVIDGYAKSGINKVSAFAEVIFPDYIHPTAAGHLLIYKNLMPYFAML